MRHCARCRRDLFGYRPHAVYCSASCRSAASRARRATADTAFRAQAIELLLAQTAATQARLAADLAMLDVERRARELFGEPDPEPATPAAQAA